MRRPLSERAARFFRHYWGILVVFGMPVAVGLTMRAIPSYVPECCFVAGAVYGWFFTYLYVTERGARQSPPS